jgi:S-adenosylhomocysteine hydrolase
VCPVLLLPSLPCHCGGPERRRCKKVFESPHIAACCVAFLAHVLERDAGAVRHELRPVLLLGYGSIGRAVAAAVRHELQLDVWVREPDDEAARDAAADGHGVVNDALAPTHGTRWHGDAAPSFRLVIGCSGSVSLNPLDPAHCARLADDAVLVSVSSGTHELAFDCDLRTAACKTACCRRAHECVA